MFQWCDILGKTILSQTERLHTVYKATKTILYKIGTNTVSLIYGKVYYKTDGVLSIVFAEILFPANVQLKLNSVQS